MFPGYLFAKIKAPDNWSALHSTRCVSRVASFYGQASRPSWKLDLIFAELGAEEWVAPLLNILNRPQVVNYL